MFNLKEKETELPKQPNKPDQAEYLKPIFDAKPLADHIYEHLLEKGSMKSFDILYLFHSYNLNYPNAKLISYMSVIAKKFATIRFAFAFYDSSIGKILYISQFSDSRNEMKRIPFNDTMDIRKSIINQDWEQKSNKIVFNFVKKSFVNLPRFTDESKIDQFIKQKDGVNDLLKHNNIRLQRHFLNTSTINPEDLKDIMNECFLTKSLDEMNKVTYLKSLYFLKRYYFKSFEEYLDCKKKKRFSNDYSDLYQLTRDYIIGYCNVYTKKIWQANFELARSEAIEFKTTNNIVEQTKGLFLISAKVPRNQTESLWLEILDNEDQERKINTE